MSKHQVGEIIEGTIIKIHNFGAMMIFLDGSRGLLHISEVANTFIRNIKKYLKIGKTYQVKIIDIEEDGFLKLSMAQISEQEKEEYHSLIAKKVTIDEERVDFTALKNKINEWIKTEKGEKND